MITEATRNGFAALQELIERDGKGGRWLVLTHDNPDPDALASAQILACILRGTFKQKVTTAYGGIIGRAENREMVRSLQLPFSHIRHLSFKKYQHFALVDSQPKSGNNQIPPRVVPDVVIDHHPVRRQHPERALLRRPARSMAPPPPSSPSTCSLSGVKPSHALATALIYAIRSETQEFAREYTGPDKAILDLFFPQANHRLLARIQSPRLPLSYFSNLHDALENLEAVDSLILSHLGSVEQPDIVPEIADLLLRMAGRTWSLATGYYGDRLYLSIRTTNTRADAGGLMQRIVGRRGKGGGHGMIAGGWIDASRLTSPADRKDLQKRLGARLARELKKNPERIEKIELREAVKPAPPKEAAKPEGGPPPPLPDKGAP